MDDTGTCPSSHDLAENAALNLLQFGRDGSTLPLRCGLTDLAILRRVQDVDRKRSARALCLPRLQQSFVGSMLLRNRSQPAYISRWIIAIAVTITFFDLRRVICVLGFRFISGADFHKCAQGILWRNSFHLYRLCSIL